MTMNFTAYSSNETGISVDWPVVGLIVALLVFFRLLRIVDGRWKNWSQELRMDGTYRIDLLEQCRLVLSYYTGGVSQGREWILPMKGP